MNKFVVQKVVRTHQIKGCERFCTWRTVSEPKSEYAALRQLLKLPSLGEFRLLNSPSEKEMTLGAETQEWTR